MQVITTDNKYTINGYRGTVYAAWAGSDVSPASPAALFKEPTVLCGDVSAYAREDAKWAKHPKMEVKEGETVLVDGKKCTVKIIGYSCLDQIQFIEQ